MKSKCLVVPRKEGENVRKELSKKGLLRNDLEIVPDGDFLCIPVTDIPPHSKYKTKEMDFRVRSVHSGDYRHFLDLPPDLKALLPASMDFIGDVAVMKLLEELEPHKHEIAHALVKAKSVRAVALDRGVQGDLRVRNLEFLIGGEKTTATHREYGLSYEMDLAKVYFSPRLASERKRIASMVKEGEIVFDMFCGIGPFSLMVAKYGAPKKVYSVDINPNAIEYIERNIAINRLGDKIVPILDDARRVARSIEKADRIIMNLPMSAFDFFGDALHAAKKKCMIHYYEILDREKVDDRKNDLRNKAKEMKRELKIDAREVKSYSASSVFWAFDVEVEG